MASNAEQLRHIVKVRNTLRDMNNIECTCSGFLLQQVGCMCGKLKNIAKVESELQSLLNALRVTAVDKDMFITNPDVRLDNTIGSK